MPRRSGLDVLAEIQKDPGLREIPVVIVSSTGLEEEIEAAFRIGANACVDRPPSFRGLCESVRGALDTWLDADGTPGMLDRGSSTNRA